MPSSQSFGRTRPVVAGRNGAVASAHPLATAAGLRMLQQGGNAVDALVAMAVTLGVVEPYMSGPAGVGMMLLCQPDGTGSTLNFSGHAPAQATPDKFTPQTQDQGIRSCLVPGNVAGWFEALRRHGSMPAEEIFAPAIDLAENGFPLHPFNVVLIAAALPRLNSVGLEIYGDTPLRIGAVLRQADLAESLRRLVADGADEFYRGELARQIADYVQSSGGLLTYEDLAGFEAEWETPIATDYHSLSVRTCGPNSEGFQILQTLKLLESFDLPSLGHNSARYIHLVSEAVKLAVADRIRWAGDPRFSPVPLEQLFDDDYIEARRKEIDLTNASRSEGERWRGPRVDGDVVPGNCDGLTTHLSAVDASGMVASLTQSLGNTFGSAVAVPKTGLFLNNFASWCEIDPSCPTPNLIEPGKRWACCLSPVHVLRDEDRFWFSMATPGSYGILHTTVQMLLNVIEFGADPQSAIEAARFRVFEETRMQIENRVDASVREELTRQGHALETVGEFSYLVGGGQSVMIDPESAARLGGADPRRDGYALAY